LAVSAAFSCRMFLNVFLYYSWFVFSGRYHLYPHAIFSIYIAWSDIAASTYYVPVDLFPNRCFVVVTPYLLLFAELSQQVHTGSPRLLLEKQ
jgi:hypothetical protein